MRQYVILLHELHNGQPHPCSGKYVARYHPGPRHYPLGTCILEVTNRRSQAMRFNSLADAIAEYRRVDPRVPVRGDGQPNRPMTAWTAEFIPWHGSILSSVTLKE